MWVAKTESIPNGRRIQILGDGEPITFRTYLNLLENDPDYASWYSELLAGAGYEALFWEHPPLCNTNIDLEAEFVLLDSPELARRHSNPKPFQSHFRNENEIVSFRSLGGDALLITPSPFEPLAACAHLAAFLREAPKSRVEKLWRETGRAMRTHLSDRYLWLSTSGLGVSWLHIRLDSYPKYYQHRPYAETQIPFGLR